MTSIPSPRTIVFLHAHPDDEAILTGGTIARLVAEGHRAVVVVATRGELGEEPPGLLAPGQTLAHRRTAETRWACDILGVQRVEFLDHRDSGMAGTPTNRHPDAFCNTDPARVAERVARIVEEEAAEALVVYDDHGGYGHPDHVQVHRVGLAVQQRLPDVAVYEATMNRDHLNRGIAMLRALGGDEAGVPDVPELAADFGTADADITHAVDVAPFAVTKRRAMAAHKSQIGDTSFFLQLPDAAFALGFGQEWFIATVPAAPPTVLDELAGSASPCSALG